MLKTAQKLKLVPNMQANGLTRSWWYEWVTRDLPKPDTKCLFWPVYFGQFEPFKYLISYNPWELCACPHNLQFRMWLAERG